MEKVNINPNIGPSAATPSENAQAARALVGSLDGYEITVASNPVSDLEEAAEELTFALDNTKEMALRERKERPSTIDSQIERVKLYQEMMRVSGRLFDLELVEKIIRSSKDPSEALEKIRQRFNEPTEAYAVLNDILSRLDEDDPIQPFLRATLTLLEQQSGRDIRSGLLAALGARRFADLKDPFELAQDYREVIDFPDANGMLSFIDERFGVQGFDRGLDYLLKTLAADLAEAEPGADKIRLEAAGAELGRVRILNGVRAQGHRLSERWKKVCGKIESELTAMDFLRLMLALNKETFISSNAPEPLVTLAKADSVIDRVIFLQELLRTTKDLSLQSFDTPEIRGRCLGAFQEALDLAIEREDEYLASLEDK
ncbi:MAG: type III secretion system gatekeeper subunit SctW [Deltaproteobacteria bacterium]|jgi:type III secretion protein W|nr:type III secretion system gatekeeper subunit SctW [Deltaproteobacteria bacterium]